MKNIHVNRIFITLVLPLLCALSFLGCAQKSPLKNAALVIEKQGSFAVGGSVTRQEGVYNSDGFDNFKPYPAGQTYHGDHAYVFYQIPKEAKKLPLVFLHGAGQSSKTWETTPDGRDGFQNIFLRKGFSVYLVDQPRRGRAGRSAVASNIEPIADEQMWYEIFRIGAYPDFHEGVQFPKDNESLNQFFRQMTPNTGAFDAEIVSDGISALFNEIGAENWRVRLALARLFVEAINRYGGDATLIELPKIGVYGNTHFPMSDLNNRQIANLLSDGISKKGLE
ncbi:MAG: alpha/beta fold hydrolase [Helicobacteraceae bacterium]|jgi:hypothetical protein|nr:alpha/beta fold hydrolase [Helicobacteraceae bacterium]